MTYEISKVIEIGCDLCEREDIYRFESSYPNYLILQHIRHFEGWSIGRNKRCICPRCTGRRRGADE